MSNHADQLAVNTIRTLSIDAIEKANSDTRDFQWAPLRWRIHSGQNI